MLRLPSSIRSNEKKKKMKIHIGIELKSWRASAGPLNQSTRKANIEQHWQGNDLDLWKHCYATKNANPWRKIRSYKDGRYMHIQLLHFPQSTNWAVRTTVKWTRTRCRRKKISTDAGDYNAWAVECSSQKTNQRGRQLMLVNYGYTYTFRRGDTGPIVNLTFVSVWLFDSVDA